MTAASALRAVVLTSLVAVVVVRAGTYDGPSYETILAESMVTETTEDPPRPIARTGGGSIVKQVVVDTIFAHQFADEDVESDLRRCCRDRRGGEPTPEVPSSGRLLGSRGSSHLVAGPSAYDGIDSRPRLCSHGRGGSKVTTEVLPSTPAFAVKALLDEVVVHPADENLEAVAGR